ncbi:MAG: hypothetical protein O6913_05700, partial [Chloroflexi bacterium]|nr:hypothetical protein [Chloroflexota bacterium]
MNSSRTPWPIYHDRRPVGSRWTFSFIAAALVALVVAALTFLGSPGTISAIGAFTFDAPSGTLTYTDDPGGGSNLRPTLTGGALTIENRAVVGVANSQIQRFVIDAGDGNDTIPLDSIDYALAANGFR